MKVDSTPTIYGRDDFDAYDFVAWEDQARPKHARTEMDRASCFFYNVLRHRKMVHKQASTQNHVYQPLEQKKLSIISLT